MLYIPLLHLFSVKMNKMFQPKPPVDRISKANNWLLGSCDVTVECQNKNLKHPTNKWILIQRTTWNALSGQP